MWITGDFHLSWLRLHRQPLHLAALEGHGELVDFLVENQAVPWFGNKRVPGKSGMTSYTGYM